MTALPLLLLLTSAARAADTPEHLLPATTQVYFRWDGVAAHRDAYAKVATGKILSGDLGALAKSLLGQYHDFLQSSLVSDKLLDGVPPEQLERLQADIAQAGKLPNAILEHGLVVGLEVRPFGGLVGGLMGQVRGALGKPPAPNNKDPLTPEVYLYLILPNGAADAPAVLGTLRLLAQDRGAPATEAKIAGRAVTQFERDGLNFAAWVEGPHVIVTVGNRPAAETVAHLLRHGKKLDETSLYQRVRNFKDYPTDVRGFADLGGLLKAGRALLTLAAAADATVGKDIGARIDALGLTGIGPMTMVWGFDGPVRCSRIEIDLPGPRRGVAKLFAGQPLTLADVPPLPADASRWSARRIDPQGVYDIFLNAAALAGRFDDPEPPKPGQKRDPARELEALADRFDSIAGFKVRTELLDNLGDRLVLYTTPAEGAFAFNQAALIEVKDGQKVLECLDLLVQGSVFGGDLKIKTRLYQGVPVREVSPRRNTNLVVPSYAVVDNKWLVIGLYPQAVQAFIQRSQGGLPAWQPDVTTRDAFARLPKSGQCLAMSDLRPSVTQVLTFAPFILEATRLGGGGKPVIEPGLLPSAATVCRHLFPNVVVQHDDGRTVRWDSRGSVLLPGDSLGVDPLLLGFTLAAFN